MSNSRTVREKTRKIEFQAERKQRLIWSLHHLNILQTFLHPHIYLSSLIHSLLCSFHFDFITNRDCNLSVIRLNVVQCRFEENVTYQKFTIIRNIFECYRTTFGSPFAQVARSHIPSFRSLTTFSFNIRNTS